LGQNACATPYLGGNFGNQIENKRTLRIYYAYSDKDLCGGLTPHNQYHVE
jgi:hypothetical protein